MEQVKVSRKFANDFEQVSKFYQLRELAEYESAKQAARADMEAAATSFGLMAQEIKDGVQLQ